MGCYGGFGNGFGGGFGAPAPVYATPAYGCGGGMNYGGSTFVLIVVLFILLIIVGASWF